MSCRMLDWKLYLYGKVSVMKCFKSCGIFKISAVEIPGNFVFGLDIDLL